MSATKRLPRIPTQGNTFAELVYHLTSYYKSDGGPQFREDWPTVPHLLACALVPISRKLHKLAEDQCNRPENYAGEFPHRCGRLISAARDLLPESIKPLRKTDPRAGYGLGLIFPDGRTNDAGSTCVIVPTKVTA